MPTLTAYENGLSLGWAGGRPPCPRGSVIWLGSGCCHADTCACNQGNRVLCCAHGPAKRGRNAGWSPGATRRNTAFLRSIDTTQLDGDGYAFTLTVRDIPESAEAYAYAVKRFTERLRHAGCTRWHRVVELTKRRRPHGHGCVYFPEGWVPPGSPIMHTASAREAAVRVWLIRQWVEVAGQWGTGSMGQDVKPVEGAVGWLKYLAKHAGRGAKHYQRQGTPPGWESMPQMWGKGGDWPAREPLRIDLTPDQAHRFRRLVKRYAIAQRRAEALDYERRGRRDAAAMAWDGVAYLRGMLKSSERNESSVRGVSEWASAEVVVRLAESVGWAGALA